MALFETLTDLQIRRSANDILKDDEQVIGECVGLLNISKKNNKFKIDLFNLGLSNNQAIFFVVTDKRIVFMLYRAIDLKIKKVISVNLDSLQSVEKISNNPSYFSLLLKRAGEEYLLLLPKNNNLFIRRQKENSIRIAGYLNHLFSNLNLPISDKEHKKYGYNRMINHFSDIGYIIENKEDMLNMAKFTLRGESLPAIENQYSLVKDKSGAEVWFLIDKKEILCINPHFEGKTKSKILITDQQVSKKCKNCVTFSGWMSPKNEKDPESGLYPIGFGVPNAMLLEKISLPELIDVQLTAFAEDINVYKNEKEFSEYRKGFVSYYFIPTGRFPVEEDRQSSAMFAGTVKKVRVLRNTITKSSFYWIVINTYGTDIDIVCEKTAVNHSVRVGNIIDGLFWLSGKILQ